MNCIGGKLMDLQVQHLFDISNEYSFLRLHGKYKLGIIIDFVSEDLPEYYKYLDSSNRKEFLKDYGDYFVDQIDIHSDGIILHLYT